MEPRGKAVPRGAATSPESAMASELFDQFVSAATFKSVLHSNRQLCELLRLKPTNVTNFYPRLKAKLHSWRAASLWAKLDKRASHKCYNRGKACPNTRVLIIGAGPCGLRAAIEAQLLGAKVVVLEKRDRFSRNNVLHLWPFVIHDLRNLGAKKFFGKFCAGSIDHISIRQLQIILLKVALLLGVEVHENVGFDGLIEPPEDQHERIGWHAQVSPADHPVSQYEFDVLIGADGKRNTLLGFNRKEFRGKLAIAVTANFINRHSPEEARVPEISGVAFIFNQKFFQDMKEQTSIDLENIVYYKDDTHYFVMTAKKQSLLERGVIIKDYNDTARLLAAENVDREALMEYARDAADFATSYQLPHLDFAVNHYGQADVAMFDFTSMYAAENACRVIERRGHKLLQGLVGDSLLEPFWPTGSGCARGFLSSFDAAWMIRSWASGKVSILQVLAERESIYRLLAQTTPENLSKDLNQYTLNPSSRYPNLNLSAVLPFQVRSLFDTDGKIEDDIIDATVELPKKKRRKESMIHPDTLLNWCQKQVALSDKVKIQDFTTSWKDGLALCAILHRYRPDLIDINKLDPENVAQNNQQAFDICEKELGIPPVMTGQEMSECGVPDKLTMVSYISQVYESFRGEIPVVSRKSDLGEERTASPSKQFYSTPLSILNKVSSRLQNKRKYSVEKEMAKDKERGENVRKRSSLLTHKRRSREKAFGQDKNQDIILTDYKSIPMNKPRESINTRVRNLEEKMKKDAGLRCHVAEDSDNTRAPHVRSEQAELNIKMLQQQLQNNGGEANVKKNKVPKVGKLRKDEWNVKIIEEKIKQQSTQQQKNTTPDKPKVYHEIFASKLQQMNDKLKAGGTLTPEEEARYKKFDASLTRLKDRLSKGNLDVGDRGRNQIAAMTDRMTKIWDLKKGRGKDSSSGPHVKGVVETDSQKSAAGSTVCYFCKERVYLLERLSAEGLFFHRTCFKCEYCNTALRLGDYSFDKDSGGKFYCKLHFRMQKTDLRQQEIMKRKEAFLSCALENQEKEKLYKILLDNAEKALSPRQSTESAKTTPEETAVAEKERKDIHISPANLLAEPPNTIPRDQTPERVEYENSIIEMSEDELLVSELEEEELTQKNLGPSHDLATSEDDYSDLSTDSETDEEAFAEELERSLTADETRKLAETWNQKYSAEQSLIYSGDSSSSDDESSDTEIGSDDTSQDVDSDAEYSIERDEEDGEETGETEIEYSALPKTPEEKEFTMEVPIIDLKSMNRATEDDTTSESDSKDITDSEEESGDETGTEVDTESESESESNPLPPPQIPTIVIYESPPQNPELDQEWNENAASEKSVPSAADNTIVLSSDTSAANSGDEQNDASVEVIATNVDPSDTKAEAASSLDDRNADGKFTRLSDMDKNIDSPCSRVDFGVSVVEISEAVSSPDLESPLKSTAPLATGESSSDLSASSDIESLAQDIVSGVLKAAQDSILQRLLTTSVEKKKRTTQPSAVNSEEILIDETSEKIVCSQSVETPIIDLVTPEKADDKEVHKPKVEEIDLCSPVYHTQNAVPIDEVSNESKEENLGVMCSKSTKKLSGAEIQSVEDPSIAMGKEKPSNEDAYPLKSITDEELETKSSFLEENQVEKPDIQDTVILDSSQEFSFCNESPNDSKNITFRKKNTSCRNDGYDWDSDKSISFPSCYYEEEDIGVSVDDFVKKDLTDITSADYSNPEVNEEEEIIPELRKVPCAKEEIISNSDITKPSDIVNSCLSQSLPNNSSSFLTGMSFPKTVSYTSAEFETAKLGSTEPKSNGKDLPSKLSKETCYSRFADDIMSRSDSAVVTSTVSKQEASGLNTSKEETKYKGYSGSFAEKVRPKSLFSDAIYLRSLDIKLQKQPFPSLNKSDDKLDECCKAEDDPVRRKLFGDNRSIELDSPNIISSIKSPASTAVCQTPSSVTASDVSCLKHKASVEVSDKLPSLSKQKVSGHKHSSVSFSAQDSYTDLVSPYTCIQSKTPASFPTKVKPKCDMDISKLRQRREKRKSVHEDIQGLPFADEEKLISPVDPIGSSDVFLTPTELSKPDLLSNVNSSIPSKTPDLIDEDRYLRVQSTVDQEKARQEARARARLKSDEELGLSPNNYRKKYRRQLSLNSINYDELCSDEFCDQDDELEDDIISNICQMKNTGIEDTFNMIKKTELLPRTKTPETPLASSQQFFTPIETKLSSTEDELFLSTDSLDVPRGKAESSTKKIAPVIKPPKHSTITSSSETSPDICIVEPSFDSKPITKSKNSLLDGSGEEEKSKHNGKKSIFSILNFGKGNQSKEKARQKSKSSEKDLSSSLPNDIGARSAVKAKPFSNLKLSKSKEKSPKPKSKSVPPESLPTSPLENSFPQEESSNYSFSSQLAKTIPKYTVYRNPENTISTFPVHLPVPKMENGLAPKASEDSFSDEDDTQGSRSGHFPSSEKADKSSLDKERKAQRIVQKVQRQQVLKRIRNAQEIQRRLEELEIQQKELEQQGVDVEKMLRGEGNRRGKTEAELMQEWYTLIHTKNKLNREVQEHLIRLKDLELEDRQSRLHKDFAQRMAEDSQKNATQLIEERKILDEMLKIVDQRNELVAVLEQLRLREEEEEKTITTSDVFTKGMKSPISSGEKS